uniref:Uncharacterized protein n=1 Tax=Anguilla anguilla TaxID=7936 RepID=A0A0E9T9C5_ANGAN
MEGTKAAKGCGTSKQNKGDFLQMG